MKRYLLILFAVWLCLTAADAKEKQDREPYDLRRHEFSLYGACYPGRYAFGYDFELYPYLNKYHTSSNGPVSSIYTDGATYNKERVTNSWTLMYTYNFTKVFALSLGLSYEGGWNEYFRREDNRKLLSLQSHYFSPMLTARFSWLNRKLLRMYSSAGLGFSVGLNDSKYKGPPTSTKFSMQVTPVGVSVGKDVFGFAEVGIGTIYVGGCLGIGYRF